MSATESHNPANLRMAREQFFAGLIAVAAIARSAGIAAYVLLSCAFGCPMEVGVPMEAVLGWCGRYIETLGAHGVTLCDTTGMAFLTQVLVMARLPRTMAHHRIHTALSQHPRYRPGQCAGGYRRRPRPFRHLVRRHRWLPLCAGCWLDLQPRPADFDEIRTPALARVAA